MRKTTLTISIIIAVSCIAGCSIKEDRKDCPCILTVILNKVPVRIMDKADGLWLNISTEGKGTALDSPLTGSDYSEPEWLETDVQKGLVSVVCSSSKSLNVPYGSECDSLYAHSVKLRCYEDNARDTIYLKKQWCTATIIVEDAEPEEEYFFEVRGMWAGVSASGLTPLPGEFYAVPRRLDAGTFQVRLPRQGDESLSMTLNNLYKYSLGKIIAGSGYDWKAPDLDDIKVVIDCARAEVQVTISPWEDGTDLGDLEI